jgi:hypothetical protein
MLPVPIATYPDTFSGKFGHEPDRLGVEGQRLLPQLVFQERLTLNSAQSRGLGASLLGVGVNSLGPSDLTEAKKVGRAIDHCYCSGLPKMRLIFGQLAVLSGYTWTPKKSEFW